MQEWLKDKKNMPIVAGGSVAILVAALAFILYNAGVFKPAEKPPPQYLAGAGSAGPMPPGARPGMPPGTIPPRPPGTPGAMPPMGAMPPPGAMQMAGRPGVPGAAPGAPALAAVPTVNPLGVHDPFYAKRTKLPDNTGQATNALIQGISTGLSRLSAQLRPKMRDVVGPLSIASYAGKGATTDVISPLVVPPPAQPTNMRLSGIVNSPTDGTNAIVEIDGQSQTVKPGDPTTAGKVVSIQSDSITLNKDGRDVTIPVSSAPTGNPNPGYGGGYGGYGGNQPYPGANPGYPGAQAYPGGGSPNYPGGAYPGGANPSSPGPPVMMMPGGDG